jgi:hypothetical protein
MADDGGVVGGMGIIIGACVIIVVGLAVLFATGNLSSQSSKAEGNAPKAATATKTK